MGPQMTATSPAGTTISPITESGEKRVTIPAYALVGLTNFTAAPVDVISTSAKVSKDHCPH